MGRDFQVDEVAVVWIVGVGGALATALGSIIGGHVADRADRVLAYLACGGCVGCVSAAMSVLPHVGLAFMIGVWAYALFAGMCSALFQTLFLELVENSALGATQYALLFSAWSAGTVYMMTLDGHGYARFGVSGLLGVDGALCVLGAVVGGGIVVGRRGWRAKAS